MANTGAARLRFDYEHRDVCLNCILDPCVLDIPGQSESLKCPYNRLRAEHKVELAEQRATVTEAPD